MTITPILGSTVCALAMASHAFAAEAITNGGFESGTTNWTLNVGAGAASVSAAFANSGSHSLALTGNDSSASQTFSAIAVSSISALSLYAYSDNGALDAVVFTYADASTSIADIMGLGDTGWTWYDLTSGLVSGQSLVGITIYGALDQTNYIDDVSLATSTAPPVPEPSTWSLMLAGLAMVGVARRTRRLASAQQGPAGA